MTTPCHVCMMLGANGIDVPCSLCDAPKPDNSAAVAELVRAITCPTCSLPRCAAAFSAWGERCRCGEGRR